MEVTFKDFSGGLVTEATRTELAQSQYSRLKNMTVAAQGGRCVLRPGQDLILPSGLPAGMSVQGFTPATISGLPFLIYARSDSAVYARNLNTNAEQLISIGSGNTSNKYTFARYTTFGEDKVFWTDTVGPLMEWGGTGSAIQVGLFAPASGLTVGTPIVTGGLIEGRSYAWYATFGTPDGLESNPSPITPYSTISGGSFLSQNYRQTLNGLPISIDPRIDRRYIYRVGDSISIPTRVGTVLDNVTTTFVDGVSDLDAGVITLSFSHTMPPAGMSNLVVNKSRLIASRKSEVYVSNLGQPEYFPVTYTNPTTDGNQFGVDDDPNNPIVALGTTGSATLILRLRDVYILQGQQANQMTLNRIAAVGCVAQRSFAMCGTLAVWLGSDAMVWALGAEDPVRLGAPIERTLKSIPASWLPNACAAFFDSRYVISIPGPGSSDIPYCYEYDFRNNIWTDLSDPIMAGTQLYADQGVGVTNNLLLAAAPGYRRGDTTSPGATYNGIVNSFSPNDPIDAYVDIESCIVNKFHLSAYGTVINDTGWRARVRSVRVRGKLTPTAGQSVIITITAQTGSTVNTRSYALTPGSADSSVLLERNVDAILQGRDISWRITGQARVLEIEEVSLNCIRTGQVII